MQAAAPPSPPRSWVSRNGAGLHTPGKSYKRDEGTLNAYTASTDERLGLLNPLESPVRVTRTVVPHEGYAGLWVMAYGVEDHTRLPAIHALLEFGDLLEVRRGDGNYILARFADSFAAQSALYRRVVLLNDRSVIGLCPPPPGSNIDIEDVPVDPLGLPPSALASAAPPRVLQSLWAQLGGALARVWRKLL